MKVLFVHNRYQNQGGEDTVVKAEAALLEANGHQVVRYERSNHELRSDGLFGAGLGTVWARKSFNALKALIVEEETDVAHFHNTFPLISPSGYYACAESGVPVIQT